MSSTPTSPASSNAAETLPSIAREVEEFVASGGWEQPPQLFALVPTAALVAQQPELADQLTDGGSLTPVAQDALPDGDLAETLATITWPEVITGCVLVQEIVVLPPDAEAALDESVTTGDSEGLRRFAAGHPRRREARLVAAAVRDGTVACVLRLRGDIERPDEVVAHPELAPNLTEALLDTLRP
jgi:hypothetical protein